MGLFGSILGTVGSSLIGGLFGKKSGAGPYRAGQQQALGSLSQAQKGYESLARLGRTGLETSDPMFRDAAKDRVNYLSQEPGTDSRDAFDINRMTEGMTRDYLTAKANIFANSAERGSLSPDDSPISDGLTGLEVGRMGILGQARNRLAGQRIQDRDSRSEAILRTLGLLRGGDMDTTLAGLGGQADIGSRLSGEYGRMGDYEDARADQYNAGVGGALGQLGSAVGDYFGERSAGGTPPVAPGPVEGSGAGDGFDGGRYLSPETLRQLLGKGKPFSASLGGYTIGGR